MNNSIRSLTTRTLAAAAIIISSLLCSGCLADARAGAAGDGGMRGGSFSSSRGQYAQHPTESKHYLKHVLNN
jgi:hypothetical protein